MAILLRFTIAMALLLGCTPLGIGMLFVILPHALGLGGH